MEFKQDNTIGRGPDFFFSLKQSGRESLHFSRTNICYVQLANQIMSNNSTAELFFWWQLQDNEHGNNLLCRMHFQLLYYGFVNISTSYMLNREPQEKLAELGMVSLDEFSDESTIWPGKNMI